MALKKQLENPSLTQEQEGRDRRRDQGHRDAREGRLRAGDSGDGGEASDGADLVRSSYKPQDIYAAGLEVEINGKKKRLEIDTGASGLIVAAPWPRARGWFPSSRAKTGGIGD